MGILPGSGLHLAVVRPSPAFDQGFTNRLLTHTTQTNTPHIKQLFELSCAFQWCFEAVSVPLVCQDWDSVLRNPPVA